MNEQHKQTLKVARTFPDMWQQVRSYTLERDWYVLKGNMENPTLPYF